MSSDILLIFSLFSLGFVGGFSHCIGMCGPFVISQVNSRLSNVEIEKYGNFTRLKNLALLPYHLGRICTYAILGFVSALLTTNSHDLIGFRIFSIIFLILAILVFIKILLSDILQINAPILAKLGLFFKTKNINYGCFFNSKRISFLFKNPVGLKGFLLGIILGFIPCGLLYAALITSANMTNLLLAPLGMLAFGIATFPALFATAIGFNFFKKTKIFKILSILIVIINICSLSFMVFSLI